jgi:uncharacterized integral membrane protein
MSDKDDDVIVLIEDNMNKFNIQSDLVNVANSPACSVDNKLLTLYEFNDKKTTECQTESSDIVNDINYRKEKLLKSIKENKRKITTSLYIISAKYDLIYFRYNRISLLILIISTITTFIEAIRLTLVNYQNDNKDSEMSLIISKDTITLIINLFSLVLGTLLTILSSIVKFRNYRENMEKLKNIHDILFNYKDLYNKQRDLIDFFTISNNLTPELFDKLVENVETYNKEIKDINIFENIRIKDIIKFNRVKVSHDIELKKLTNKRELEFLKLTIEATKNKIMYNADKINAENHNLIEKKTSCF